MHKNNTNIVRRNLWSRGYSVKLPVPETELFDLVVEGLRVRVTEVVKTEEAGFDVLARVMKGTGAFKGRNVIMYYRGSVQSENPKDIFINNKKIDEKNEEHQGAGVKKKRKKSQSKKDEK